MVTSISSCAAVFAGVYCLAVLERRANQHSTFFRRDLPSGTPNYSIGIGVDDVALLDQRTLSVADRCCTTPLVNEHVRLRYYEEMARRAKNKVAKRPKAAERYERLIEEFNKLKNPRPMPLSKLKDQTKLKG
jgi:hypothetical protein